MSIDGIGKPGGLPPGGLGGSAGAPSVGGAGEPFRVRSSDAAGGVGQAEEAGSITGSDALRALERGDLSIDGYLELRVEEATRHLGALAPEQMEIVKDTLRAQLRTDPVLLELVRRATGVLVE